MIVLRFKSCCDDCPFMSLDVKKDEDIVADGRIFKSGNLYFSCRKSDVCKFYIDSLEKQELEFGKLIKELKDDSIKN